MLLKLIVTVLPILFLAVLFIGGNLFRKRNIDMDGDPPINRAVFYSSKYAIVLIWAAMVIQIWGVNLAFFAIPDYIRTISLIFWLAGFSLLFIGRFSMGWSFRIGSPKEETSLTQDGLFSFSRNPMYLGVFSTLLATVLYTLNPLIFFIVLFIVIAHHKIVIAEEKYLNEVFGEQYLVYCKKTRRYI